MTPGLPVDNRPAEAGPALRIRNLERSFPGVNALDGIDLDVPRGSVYVLVGPDGAGKSTLIRIVCGLLRAQGGSVEILGVDAFGRNRELRRRIGYLSQRFSLYGDLSIDENLAFSAEIFGMRSYSERRNELLEMTGLTPFRDRPADKLSGGMRQKLALACTLIHDPEIIFLDEPTNGVDPVSRREFWKLLRGLGERGITLLMSTPYLDEAERADRVALLHGGRVILEGVPGDIRREWPMQILEFFCSDNRKAAEHLNRRFPEGKTQTFGDRVHLVLPEGGPDSSAVAGELENDGVIVKRHGSARPGLENVFLSLIEDADDG